jgi:hypothetical protein
MNQKVFPIIALIVMLLSGTALAFQARASISSQDSNWLQSLDASIEKALQSLSEAFSEDFETQEDSEVRQPGADSSPATPSPTPLTTTRPSSTPRATAQPAATARPAATSKPSVTATPPSQVIPPRQPTESCRRFVVRHLDGSTSNRCYSDEDYRQLSSLSTQLSSAQTFYNFHMDGVARYQKLHDESGSSLWLDAKASSQASADREKEKIGAVSLQMYTIESRGKD